MAVTSCILDDPEYSVTNVNNYLNYNDGILMNDAGVTFTVKEDLTDTKWKAEGNRFYATFDILNIGYDICLKSYLETIIQNAEPLPEVEGEEGIHGDPVSIVDCCLSGIYLNLIIGFYAKAGTDNAHDMHLYWKDDHSTLSLVLIHNGNGENPVAMDINDMTFLTRVYCFPIYDLVMPGEQRSVVLSIDALAKESDGTYVSKPFTSSVYGGMVTF